MKQCIQCQQTKLLTDFHRRKNKTDGRMQICADCYMLNLRETQQKQREFQQRRRQQLEETARRAEEERLRNWPAIERIVRRQQLSQAYFDSPGAESKRALALELYQEQYEKLAPQGCRDCKQLLPATSFDLRISDPGHLSLYARCWDCHEKYLQRNPRQYPHCPLCGQKKHWRMFISHYESYVLVRDGTYIHFCCKDCEPAFLALPASQQAFYIRSRCNLTFPSGQVIYGLVDPESRLVRYVGRTHDQRSRLKEHLKDRSDIQPCIMSNGQSKPYYSRPNWMLDLYNRGLQPIMKILAYVEVAPQSIEWERRYLLHGFQQGWPLVNVEAAMDDLVAQARASRLDFLHCSFEDLVQERFIREKGIEAFVRQFYRPE